MNGPIIIEQSFKAFNPELWQALTDLEKMKLWFFPNIPEFEAKKGFQTKFSVISGEREFIHVWRIIEVVPNKKIVYDWSYEGIPGKSYVTFEILFKNQQNIVQISHQGWESFPQDIVEFRRESGHAGWEYFIQKRLKNYLEP